MTKSCARRRSGVIVVPLAILCQLLLAGGADAPAADLRIVRPVPYGLNAASVTLVPDGRILVYSGDTATIWSPAERRWQPVPQPAGNQQRYQHTASLLGNGDVVLLGGAAADSRAYGLQTALSSNLTWQSGRNLWLAGPSLLEPRIGHTATVLPSDELLVVGGSVSIDRGKPTVPMLASVELLSDKSSRRTAPLSVARANHTASLLADGRVLIAGGTGSDGRALAAVEIYDPASGRWQQGPALLTARSDHTATVLGDGSVLIVGGRDIEGHALRSTELLNRDATRWHAAGNLDQARYQHVASQLPNGQVLITGGVGDREIPALELEVRTTAGAWQPAGRSFRPLRSHQAIVLPIGRVLLFTYDSTAQNTILAWIPDRPERQRQDLPANGTIVSLDDGRFLLIGGARRGVSSAEASLYDPADDRWFAARSMHWPRNSVRALRLADRRVLAVGAVDDTSRDRDRPDSRNTPTYPAEVWDPKTGRWSESAALTFAANSFADLALLADGHVWVGGIDSTSFYGDVIGRYRIWDPVTDAVSAVREIVRPTPAGVAMRLHDGRVLYAGGVVDRAAAGGSRRLEQWSPGTATWHRVDDAPVPLPGLRFRVLSDDRLIAWQPSTGGDDAAGEIQVWRDERGWTTLPAPTALRDNESVEFAALSDGDILLVIAGRDSWVWSSRTPDWVRIAHDGPWSSLQSIGFDAMHNPLAFRGASVDGGSSSVLAVSVLNRQMARWEPRLAGYVPREYPSMTLLPAGQVLVAGGGNGVVQLYDAAHNQWRHDTYLPAPLFAPQSTLLADGRVMLVGFTDRDQRTLQCYLRDADHRWRDCEQFSLDPGESSRSVLLRRHGENQALLVYGKQRAMLWEARSGWTSAALRAPQDESLPPAGEQGTTYLNDIVDVWNASARQWEDASDALFVNTLRRPVARGEGGAFLSLMQGGRIVSWDPGTHLLQGISLQAAPIDTELNALVQTRANCVLAWNSDSRRDYDAYLGNAVPTVFAGDLTQKVWSAADDLFLEPIRTTAIQLPDGSVLFAGRSGSGDRSGDGVQRLRADCSTVTAIDAPGELYLPVSSKPSRPAVSASAPFSTPQSPELTILARMRSTTADTLRELRVHPVAKFLCGLLLLLVVRRFARRWTTYIVDELGHNPWRRFDLGLAVAGLVALLAAIPLPWPRTQALLALVAAVTLFIPLWRLFENADGRRAKITIGLPYVAGTAMAALGAGTALLEILTRGWHFLTDYQ